MHYLIGKFSDIVKIPPKTLRYYDSIGLFSPEYTDNTTNYRYYSDSQISEILLISELRKYDLSIKDIKDMIESESEEHFLNKLCSQIEAVEERLSQLESVKRNLEKRYELMKNNESFWKICGYNGMVIKNAEEKCVYFETFLISEESYYLSGENEYYETDRYIKTVRQRLIERNIKFEDLPMIIYHYDSKSSEENKIETDIMFKINSISGIPKERLKKIPKGKYASTTCVFSIPDDEYNVKLLNVDKQFFREIEEANYKILDTPIEIRHKIPGNSMERHEQIYEYLIRIE